MSLLMYLGKPEVINVFGERQIPPITLDEPFLYRLNHIILKILKE